MSPPLRSNQPKDSAPYLTSVIPENRLRVLHDLCSDTLRRCPGNVLEVGVYKGGSLLILAEAVRTICPSFSVFGLDTFEGHPYTDGHPQHPAGKYSDVSIQDLAARISQTSLGPWINLLKGRVEHILQDIADHRFSFAHIDCDLYTPVRYCATRVPSLLHPGGIIYFDDYGHEHCPGATKAVQETFSLDMIQEIYLPEDNTLWSAYIRI